MKIEFDVPNLSGLRPHSAIFVAHMFRGAGLKRIETYALVMNLIRLVDLAIREYESGRVALNTFASTNDSLPVGAILRASGHFEVCICSVKRAINHVKAMRSYEGAPQSLKDLLPRSLTILTGDVERSITCMRDAIQHLERDVLRRQLPADSSLCLMPSMDGRGLELGEHTILFSDLAAWLQELHTCAEHQYQYREE